MKYLAAYAPALKLVPLVIRSGCNWVSRHCLSLITRSCDDGLLHKFPCMRVILLHRRPSLIFVSCIC